MAWKGRGVPFSLLSILFGVLNQLADLSTRGASDATHSSAVSPVPCQRDEIELSHLERPPPPPHPRRWARRRE
eukprot:scaffold59695_cov22-Tisochrysis_lutea.AAC.1